MTLDAFLEHHGLTDNPFAGEEARQDAVLARMTDPLSPLRSARHADYQKIVGDISRPSTAVVFGEKGSGKTTLRLQIAAAVEKHNQINPARRVLLVPHDDLQPMLERLHARLRTHSRGKESPVLDSLKKVRLSDHLDMVCCLVVPRLVDALLEEPPRGEPIAVGASPRLALKTLDRTLKRDLMVLQAAYDRAENAGERTVALRRAMQLRRPIARYIEGTLAYAGWLLPATVFCLWWMKTDRQWEPAWISAFFGSAGVWFAFLLKRAVSDRFGLVRRAHRLHRQVRVSGRPEPSFLASLRELYPWWRTSSILPTTDSESVRFEMIDRLVRVLRNFSHAGLIVVLDRVDEPPLIAGDAERMRAVVWPLLNNKLLQHESLVFKMLLPMELRHILLRESAQFYTAARLDKQNLIEDLGWTGPTLYDLCNLRLAACARKSEIPDAIPTTLGHLFADDVTRQDLTDALEAMRQPRDAFKLLYHCVSEHCAATSDDSGHWRITRATLDRVKKAQLERVRQVQMGVRPG